MRDDTVARHDEGNGVGAQRQPDGPGIPSSPEPGSEPSVRPDPPIRNPRGQAPDLPLKWRPSAKVYPKVDDSQGPVNISGQLFHPLLRPTLRVRLLHISLRCLFREPSAAQLPRKGALSILFGPARENDDAEALVCRRQTRPASVGLKYPRDRGKDFAHRRVAFRFIKSHSTSNSAERKMAWTAR